MVSSWRLALLIHAVSVTEGFRGFATRQHLRHKKTLSNTHHNNNIRSCLWLWCNKNDLDGEILLEDRPPQWLSRCATSIIVAGVSISFLGGPGEAKALDTPSFIILQQQGEMKISTLYTSSIEGAYQRFLHSDTAMQYQNLLSRSDQSTSSSVVQPIISPSQTTPKKSSELKTSDIQSIAKENKIDVELICTDSQRPLDMTAPIVKIDREKFQKVKVYQPPFLRYLPSSMQPLVSNQFQSLQVLKSIPNEQLFAASVFAGSLTESVRVLLLYPLSTVKARVQARTSRSGTNRKRSLKRKLKLSWLTFLYETKRGDWYDGILPSLLITVPASGVYSGAKEVSRRAFSMAIQVQLVQNLFPAGDDAVASSYYSALVVNLMAAFVADIAALAIRTPADVLALRLQVFGKGNVKSDFGNWAKDSVALLPSMIICDIPFLLSRIFLNAAITTQGENLGKYEAETIAVACLCAFLTTPFDVARTRILLPTTPLQEEDYEEKGDDESTPLFQSEKNRRLVASSKFREQRRQKLSVVGTMKQVVAEGNGGVENLYAGWIERTAFLGIGRAWLDPLRAIAFLGIRDSVLLKLFD